MRGVRGWVGVGGGGSSNSLLSSYCCSTCIMYNTACLMNNTEVSERGKIRKQYLVHGFHNVHQQR